MSPEERHTALTLIRLMGALGLLVGVAVGVAGGAMGGVAAAVGYGLWAIILHARGPQ